MIRHTADRNVLTTYVPLGISCTILYIIFPFSAVPPFKSSRIRLARALAGFCGTLLAAKSPEVRKKEWSWCGGEVEVEDNGEG